MSAKPKPESKFEPEAEPKGAPPLKDYKEIPGLKGTNLAKLIQKKVLLDQERARIEAAVKAVGTDIEAVFFKMGLPGVIWNHRPVRVVPGTRKSLSREKATNALLEAGVAADVIEKAMDEATSESAYTYVRVWPAKG